MEFEHDIFLCHNSDNKDWVRTLSTKIESEEYEGGHLKVFFDEWDVQPGANIVLELEKALSKSRFVGVVLSLEMLKAEWPTMEWTIAVSDDPSGRKGKVVPILLDNCDIPASLKIRNVLFFRNDVEYKKSYLRLISMLKGDLLPRNSRISTTSHQNSTESNFPLQYHDVQNEQLASNLFPVTRFPDTIWSGSVGTLTYKDTYAHLRKTVKGISPTFIIRAKKLYSFWKPDYYGCPFKELLIASNIESEPTESWISDPIKNLWLIELFNKALQNHCWDLNLIHDKKHGRFFFPSFGGANRPMTWHTGKRKSTRTITTKHIKGKSESIFWSHQALRAKFMNIDERLYLKLIPAWVFTSDGEHLLSGKDVGIFSTKWTTHERNSSVLYHIRFWSSVLSHNSDKISIQLGSEKLDVDITPAVIELNVGIEGDFHPIGKVFETGVNEIDSTEKSRDDMLQGDDPDE